MAPPSRTLPIQKDIQEERMGWFNVTARLIFILACRTIRHPTKKEYIVKATVVSVEGPDVMPTVQNLVSEAKEQKNASNIKSQCACAIKVRHPKSETAAPPFSFGVTVDDTPR